MSRDAAILRLHVVPVLGHRKIATVTPRDIQAMVGSWIASGKAPRTVRRQYDVVRAIFTYAVSADYLMRSPCRGIRLPTIEPLQRYLLTAVDVCRLAEAAGKDYQLMVYLGAVLGLRWGEAAGLRVGRLDLLRGTVLIAEQLIRGEHGRVTFGPPKSLAGNRTLAMPDALVELIAAHLRRRQLTASQPDALVFNSPSGDPLDYANWRRRVWLPACRAAGVAGAGFHDLRRSAATALVTGGVDVKTAQVRLGHADSRQTLDVYARATREADRAAAHVVGKHFFAAAEIMRCDRVEHGADVEDR